MTLTVLGCSGSESPLGHTCSYRLGPRTLLEMGSVASALPLADQSAVRDVFISHAHLDHVKDLAFFAENVLQAFERTVNVHATAYTIAKIQKHVLNGVIWPDFSRIPRPEEPVLRYVPLVPGTPVEVEDLRIHTVEVNHPGGCIAFLLESATGVLVYSGDTGPTDALWTEVNRRGDQVRAILLETSFPTRLEALADISGHLTPRTLASELEKLEAAEVPVYVHHLKAPTRDETIAELMALGDPRLRILEPGDVLEF
jgi:3',5'-cyclic-nucleotide phosphodiesterase